MWRKIWSPQLYGEKTNIGMISPKKRKLEPEDIPMFSRLQLTASCSFAPSVCSLKHQSLMRWSGTKSYRNSPGWGSNKTRERTWFVAFNIMEKYPNIRCLGYKMFNDTQYPIYGILQPTSHSHELGHKAEWYTLLLQTYPSTSSTPFMRVCPSG